MFMGKKAEGKKQRRTNKHITAGANA